MTSTKLDSNSFLIWLLCWLLLLIQQSECVVFLLICSFFSSPVNIIFSLTLIKWWISARIHLNWVWRKIIGGLFCSVTIFYSRKHTEKQIICIGGSWYSNRDAQQIRLQTCLTVNFPTEGRRPFDENTLNAWGLAIFRVKTRKGQKNKSGPLFSMLLLYGFRQAWCDFPNTARERRLDFHRPADLLTAGVSQILFQTFSFPLSCVPTILLIAYSSAYRDFNKS